MVERIAQITWETNPREGELLRLAFFFTARNLPSRTPPKKKVSGDSSHRIHVGNIWIHLPLNVAIFHLM